MGDVVFLLTVTSNSDYVRLRTEYDYLTELDPINMRQVIIDFLFLRAHNSHPVVYIGLILIYLVMLGCTISSISKESYGRGIKSAYIIIVLAIPFLGMLVYTLNCIWRADYSAVLRFKPKLKR